MLEHPNVEGTGIPLGPLTTLRVGGVAERLIEVSTDDAFIAAVSESDNRGEPLLLIGGGSNLVIADEGVPGLVVHVRTRGVTIEDLPDTEDVLVTAAAGENWDRLVARLVADGYSGPETLSGIPGSVGATPVQNVGAYGSEVAELIESVAVFDRQAGERQVLSAAECNFSYRNSAFKAMPSRWLILSVTFRVSARDESVPIRYAELAKSLGIAPGDCAVPIQVRREVLNVRRRKGMVVDIDDHDCWSVGSFFTNPIVHPTVADKLPGDAPRWSLSDGRVKLSAAWLIERAGFDRGWSLAPGAQAALSSRHTLAITNRGKATTRDVLELARAIRDGVEQRFGITLCAEPNLVRCEL